VQQTTEPVPPNHRDLLQVALICRLPTIWRREIQTPVSAMPVVVIRENGEHPLEVTGVDNEQPVETLGPDRPNESLRNRIRLWRMNGRPPNAHASALEHVIDVGRELSVPIMNQQVNGSGRSATVQAICRACWVNHAPSG
jgi:hypothetical protein